MPEVGVVIIDALREGRSVPEAAERAREHAGEEIDVPEFVQTLIDLGFVAEIDGRRLADRRDVRGGDGRVGEWLVRVGRPLFSRWAWVLYGTLFACCVVAVAAVPRVRPRGPDLLFLRGDPLDSVAVMAVASMLCGAGHEGAHWLAARVQGVPARVGISRRWYWLVLQTDMTGIWALPRRQRLSPLLAGLAFDTVRLAGLLAARIIADAGTWHPSRLLARLIMALIAATVVEMVFQFFIFLRADIYAVLITWLDCLNLTRVTQLSLRQTLPWPRTRDRDGDRDELAQASPQDLRVARWYRWVYLGGIVFAGWAFVAFFGPNIITVARSTASELARTSPPHPYFWRTLVLGSLALAPVPLTILIFVRERARPASRRRAHPTPIR
jgi:hypothetical protein